MGICRPYFKKRERLAPRTAGAGPWAVADLCRAYSWPTAAPGGGVIAIVELGGGWTSGDMAAYFTGPLAAAAPSITDVSVDGTVNTPGGEADGEVALDIQVAAVSYFVATGKPATIRVYWASDIAPAIEAAAKDGCDVCSISWGADEANWGLAAATALDAAAAAACAVGMAVFAASGDNDSSDGGPSAANVDCPASCPNVIGCGGTSKAASPPSSVVWNNEPGQSNGSGTGGGYSILFAMPAWQVANGAPADPEAGTAGGRMVPDCAANADPNTGYEIYYQSQAQIVGGTSAVAPFYAGLFAALGQKLGSGIGAKLWGNASCFVDITSGDNGDYRAQVGPDPCTGLGVPNGGALAALFAAPASTP
jgi:kumamolisin